MACIVGIFQKQNPVARFVHLDEMPVPCAVLLELGDLILLLEDRHRA